MLQAEETITNDYENGQSSQVLIFIFIILLEKGN